MQTVRSLFTQILFILSRMQILQKFFCSQTTHTEWTILKCLGVQKILQSLTRTWTLLCLLYPINVYNKIVCVAHLKSLTLSPIFSLANKLIEQTFLSHALHSSVQMFVLTYFRLNISSKISQYVIPILAHTE